MEKYYSMFAFAMTLIFLMSTPHQIRGQDPCSPSVTDSVNMTLLNDSCAVCLDGSRGGYFFDGGFGEGATNLIMYLEGGGWCDGEQDCVERSKMTINIARGLGIGSNINRTSMAFQTILSPHPSVNPDFHNWNRVFLSYCDGASFLANVQEPKSNLYLRRGRIFKAAVEEITKNRMMMNVTNAILMGESAGGLAALLNCDTFRSLLPNESTVKCVADSGFFINMDSAVTTRFIRTNAFHELASVLPTSCTARMNSSFCLFPENFIGDIQPPVFILNSAFDAFQIQQLDTPPGEEVSRWQTCTSSLPNCTANEIQIFKDFRTAFLKKLNITGVCDNPSSPSPSPSSRGMFISTCYVHDFFNRGNTSTYWSDITIDNKTIANAVGDWFFNRSDQVRLVNETDTPVLCG